MSERAVRMRARRRLGDAHLRGRRRLLGAALGAAIALSGGAAAELWSSALAPVARARPEPGTPTVFLLHGLWRSARSMRVLEEALRERGYHVRNLDYPSREADVPTLAAQLAAEVACCTASGSPVHFVTHSMGGIVVRAYLAETRPSALGRVVMLAPPNHGSELADVLRSHVWLHPAAGPAARELGTGLDGLLRRLPPPDYELGVLAGNRSWNALGSWLLPGDDDGTVSVESAKLDGMADFRVLPANHTTIMREPEVVEEVIHFLENGRFKPLEAPAPQIPVPQPAHGRAR